MWKPKFFHNFPNQGDGAESVVEVALHTSAAPTFFPTHRGYIDGGVVANNPSMSALAQAPDTAQGPGAKLEEVVLLSVSTGLEPKFIQGAPRLSRATSTHDQARRRGDLPQKPLDGLISNVR